MGRGSPFGTRAGSRLETKDVNSMTLCYERRKSLKETDTKEENSEADLTKDLTQAQIVVSALDLAIQDKEISKFKAKCRLQCYFPEKESQSKRQVDRIKLSCYFPDIEQEQNRRVFRKTCLLHCYFPDLENTNRVKKFGSLRKGSSNGKLMNSKKI